MNLFNFTGNLGQDAEVRFTQSGKPVCSFSVAVKSGYGDNQKTNWVRCSMFGKKAEGQLPQYLKKGTQVAISGELELQKWEGQNGKGAALAVNVQNIDLIGGKPEGAQPQPMQQVATGVQPAEYSPQSQPAQPNTYAAAQGGYAQPQQPPQNSMPEFSDSVPF